MVFLIKETTERASGMRNGGSMRMHALVPTIRVVTLESPFSDEEWIYVWRGEEAMVARAVNSNVV